MLTYRKRTLCITAQSDPDRVLESNYLLHSWIRFADLLFLLKKLSAWQDQESQRRQVLRSTHMEQDPRCKGFHGFGK